ncbi:hypothetical protein JMN32_14745 [Fulvivirga sp. 29W222]|uniref:ATP-grasp domain-containing protein n=1 Tax=Fulvivirga marina TaxID=2494733 RepID=A0A937KCN3_9BACT|nr:hypothetical protein [Fulvivirga marina]MBL6447574.1 hypothetical protein [Fulvivirga marina]
MKTKVCIIFGGQSSEHKDSLDSFENIYLHLQKDFNSTYYEVTHVFFATQDGGAIINEIDYSKSFEDYKEGDRIDLLEGFQYIKRNNIFLLSTLFSQNGEDGRLQGLASLMRIKSNLGEPLQPSLCSSKFHLNHFVRGIINDLNIPRTIRLAAEEELDITWDKVYGKEMVVKPNALGSSIFTDKFQFAERNKKLIKTEIRKILQEDKYALLQEYIKGQEYTCAVLRIDGKIQALPVGQVETDRNFFGYPEKASISLNRKSILENDDPITLRVAEISKTLYHEIDLNTVARFDYIYKDGEFYFLECNAFPSLHRYSFLMQMLHKDSKDILWLLDNIIYNCINN